MSAIDSDLHDRVRNLPDSEKLRLVDILLEELDRPHPEIDRIWAQEARKRHDLYKKGKIKSVSYEDAVAKYRPS